MCSKKTDPLCVPTTYCTGVRSDGASTGTHTQPLVAGSDRACDRSLLLPSRSARRIIKLVAVALAVRLGLGLVAVDIAPRRLRALHHLHLHIQPQNPKVPEPYGTPHTCQPLQPWLLIFSLTLSAACSLHVSAVHCPLSARSDLQPTTHINKTGEAHDYETMFDMLNHTMH
jgi:hypothetical protein